MHISRIIPYLMFAATVMGGLGASFAQADQRVSSVDRRWSANGPGGIPEFGRHVIPLLGKLGCNGRACHGSFQGQNGFRLSLFGHDARMDFDELVKDEGQGSRVSPKSVDESLALLKALGKEGHEGGVRFKQDSWQHRLFPLVDRRRRPI